MQSNFELIRETSAERASKIIREARRDPRAQPSETEALTNQAATAMTSSMIKQSLAQLRSKLDSMKRDKEAVELGITGYEQRYLSERENNGPRE